MYTTFLRNLIIENRRLYEKYMREKKKIIILIQKKDLKSAAIEIEKAGKLLDSYQKGKQLLKKSGVSIERETDVE